MHTRFVKVKDMILATSHEEGPIVNLTTNCMAKCSDTTKNYSFQIHKKKYIISVAVRWIFLSAISTAIVQGFNYLATAAD